MHLFGGIGAGIVFLLIALQLFTGNQTPIAGPGEPGKQTPVQKPTTTNIQPPSVTTTERATEHVATKAKPPTPEEIAQDEFEHVIQFEGLGKTDLKGRTARLEAFLKKHGDTIIASRARILMNKLQKGDVSELFEPPPVPAGYELGLLTSFYRGADFNPANKLKEKITPWVVAAFGDEAPEAGVPADDFGIRWEGFINIPETALWVFEAYYDDRARVWIDGEKIIEDWTGGPKSKRGEKQLSAGPHELKVEFYENGGGAVCKLSWAKKGKSLTYIPAPVLMRRSGTVAVNEPPRVTPPPPPPPPPPVSSTKPVTAAAALSGDRRLLDIRAETAWHSYETVISDKGVSLRDSSGKMPATLEAYQSQPPPKLTKQTGFDEFTPGSHRDAFNHLETFISPKGQQQYPYLGKSAVDRGGDKGELSPAAPLGVRDLQFHPPNGGLTLLSFIAPADGHYTVAGFSARRTHVLKATPGKKYQSIVRLFGPDGQPLSTLTAENDAAWVFEPQQYAFGQMKKGGRIQFGVERGDEWDYDATEIAWSIYLNAQEEPNTVFLSSMPEQSPLVGHGAFGKSGKLGFSEEGVDEISINGIKSPHGLSTHAIANGTSKVCYTLNKSYKLLRTGVALNDTAKKKSSELTFEVVGDGKVLWSSDPVQETGTRQGCSVDISGVDKLELRVRCKGALTYGHAVWLEPRVIK